MRRKDMPQSGIQIENTLSMALQKRTSAIRMPFLIFIALTGVYSSIFTFLSMYEMELYTVPLFIATIVLFGLFALFAATPKKIRILKIAVFSLLVLGFAVLYEKVVHGFVHLINTIYKVIYMTDQDYYLLENLLPEKLCLSVLLFFGAASIIFSVCYGVIRYQNFFMSFLTTFAVAEIGFFFGIAANHFWASLLFAFWCTSAAIRFASYGTSTEKSGSSFLRRRNVFFPVASMRFMVTGQTGMMILAGVTALCLLIDQVLMAVGYTRSEEIKKIRAGVQDFSIAMQMNENNPLYPLFQNLWNNANKKQQEVVDLNKEDDPEFENEVVSSVRFNKLPGGRVYLKYYTGHVYESNKWSLLDESVYENDLFERFDSLDYHPQEFLYYGMEAFPNGIVSMTMQNPDEIMSKCVPYGFREKDGVTCLYDDRFSETADSYSFFGGADYETLLASPQNWVELDSITLQYMIADRNSWFPETYGVSADFNFFAPQAGIDPSDLTIQASMLCETSYNTFARKHYLYVPDTPAMANVRAAYAADLNGFDAEHATPAETIVFLQHLRDALCSRVTYNLAPGKTPVERDFAEFFLLENQMGYCVHYATAGTLLARMAGIPARYCEGYIVDCSNNPTLTSVVHGGHPYYNVEILDSNAHSWTEIYIEGLGWVPFEFTFSYFTPPEEQTQTTPPPTEPTAEMTEPTMTAAAQGTTYVPPVESVTGSTDTQTETVASEVPDEMNPEGKGSALPSLLILLSVLALIGLMLAIPWLLWRFALMKRIASFDQNDPRNAMASIYTHLLQLLAYCGVTDTDGSVETFSTCAQKVCAQYLPENYSMKKAIVIAAKIRYSPHEPTKQELLYLRRCTLQLGKGIYQASGRMQRLKLKYVLHLV